MAQLNIDVTNIAPAAPVEAIPPGWYNVKIDQSEVKETKGKDGWFLEVRYAVLDGAQAGSNVFSRHNIRNNNPKAVEIAMRELSAIGHAVGVLMIADSQQLHDKPLKIKLSYKEADGQYGASNDVRAWKNVNENVDMTPGVIPPPSAPRPAAAVAPAQQPWANAPQPAQPPQHAASTHTPTQPPAVAPTPAAAPAWQPPAAQQPWAQGSTAAPQQQPAQQPAPTQQAPVAGAGVAPPWQQQAPQGGQTPPPWQQPAQG